MNTINELKDFYENRYAKGYMEEWSEDKKTRIYDVIKSLNLPDTGDALDFGCGNGIFTSVLKKALPGWNVFGCDISEIAIKNTTRRVSNCKFFVNSDKECSNKKFDFIFTHHVLEHVFDIKTAAQQITEWANNNSSMLHILPCGNSGSFEYRLCNLRHDGINQEMENRFFFEDEGHVRRMTTDSCALLLQEFGFVLQNEFYGNQYYGAIDWITRSRPKEIFMMFSPIWGKNIKAKIKLSFLLFKFLFIFILRAPRMLYEKGKKTKNFALIILSFLPFIIFKYFDEIVVFLSKDE